MGGFPAKFRYALDPDKEVRCLLARGTQGMALFVPRSQKSRYDKWTKTPAIVVVTDRTDMTILDAAQNFG